MSSVQSVERAFAILECLAAGTTKVTEIGERIGLPKSTVSRLLSTMVGIEVVEQASGAADYMLGKGFFALASSGVFDASILAIAKPYLMDLASGVGESAALAIRENFDVLYLYDGATDAEIRMRDWTGERAPMHLVPSGLVMLAHCEDDFVEEYLARPLAYSTSDSVNDPEAVGDRIVAIRDQGFAFLQGEFVDEVASMAAPIKDSSGGVIASVCVHGPRFRFPDGDPEAAIGELMETARKISRQLGWVSPE